MRGSLAIWSEEASDQPVEKRAAVELHFNMWCDLPGGIDQLDIGLRFKGNVRPKTLHMFIPGSLDESQIVDLSTVLKDPKTLSAVFNELLSVGPNVDFGFEVLDEKKNLYFTILQLEKTDLLSTKVADGKNVAGTIISFQKAALDKLSGDHDYYFRMRIPLSGKLRHLFSNESVPSESLFSHSFFRTKVVEFRVNEKRNYGDALRRLYPDIQSPRVEAIHFLLVRNIEAELARSHADFNKMRRLEPGLWRGYLDGLTPASAEKMIIYHWRARDDTKSSGKAPKNQEDFIALCSFRQPRGNVLWFIIAVILIGTMGNAVEAFLTKKIQDYFHWGMLCTQLTILGTMASLLVLLFTTFWLFKSIRARF